MKEKADLTRGWLRKAASDLKAYLTHQGATFPYTHNLAKLVEAAAAVDSRFRDLLSSADQLTANALRGPGPLRRGLLAIS